MRHITTYSLSLICLLLAAACSSAVDITDHIDAEAGIWPDYAGVTVPCNIAPLNFCIDSVADSRWAAVVESAGHSIVIHASSDGNIMIPESDWRKLTRTAGDIRVTICRDNGKGWTAYRPFTIHVSADSIDPVLVYRRIHPLYGTWRYMGIYQRDLTNYDETPIYENAAYHGNCVNCHSFAARSAGDMQLHLRGDGGGTYVVREGTCTRLDTKTDSTIANFTYPYWHPSHRYIAYSVNNIFQVFHNSDPNRVEVIDDASDIVVYDLDTNEAFSSPLIRQSHRLETFPAFSADGRRLYYCSATPPDSIPEQYKQIHYSLCAIDFDPYTRTFGNKVDTLYNAVLTDSVIPAGSMAVPRPSPDGKWLVATHSGYGNFMIWHKDADLWMLNLATGQWREMQHANSDDVDSYHSWSGNSRWLVFSSRRDNGLYTRPYIVHIDADGRESKPFILPQRNPRKYYTDLLQSYNIPELVDGPVDITTTDVLEWIDQPAEKVKYK